MQEARELVREPSTDFAANPLEVSIALSLSLLTHSELGCSNIFIFQAYRVLPTHRTAGMVFDVKENKRVLQAWITSGCVQLHILQTTNKTATKTHCSE